MIAHLTGTLFEKSVQRLVVDAHGVGYELLVPLSTFYAVGETGTAISLRVYTHVREDAIQLFGFATALEQTLFERLIAVSGIGPKLALSVLSGIEPADFVRALRQADHARLQRIPGVGRKTAERLVLELKDRLPEPATTEEPAPASSSEDSVRDDVLSALLNLGYQRPVIERALERVMRDEAARAADFEHVLRASLKAMAG